jgi:hypothetical protein
MSLNAESRFIRVATASLRVDFDEISRVLDFLFFRT